MPGSKFQGYRFKAGDQQLSAEVLQDMLEVCRELDGLAVVPPLEMVSTAGGRLLRLRGGVGGVGGAGGVAIKIKTIGAVPGRDYIVDVYPGRYDDAGVEVTTAARLAEDATAFVTNGIAATETIPADEWFDAKKVGTHYEFEADIWRAS